MLKIEFIGNLGKAPELRYTPAGKAVTNFSVAVSRKWCGDDGEKHEETQWLEVCVWVWKIIR
jgi:single-strand DNA-binding protein